VAHTSLLRLIIQCYWRDDVSDCPYPIFAFVIAFVASLNPKTRAMARDIASGFLIFHALLHYLFSVNPAYEFSSPLSSILIYGAAICGATYFVAAWLERKQGTS
jgi:hypothetical protein